MCRRCLIDVYHTSQAFNWCSDTLSTRFNITGNFQTTMMLLSDFKWFGQVCVHAMVFYWQPQTKSNPMMGKLLSQIKCMVLFALALSLTLILNGLWNEWKNRMEITVPLAKNEHQQFVCVNEIKTSCSNRYILHNSRRTEGKITSKATFKNYFQIAKLFQKYEITLYKKRQSWGKIFFFSQE